MISHLTTLSSGGTMFHFVTALFLTSLLVFGTYVFAAAASAGSICKHDSATAKTRLAAIYAGEKSYHSEYKSYSDSFGDIGFDPNITSEEESDCDTANWSFEINPLSSPDRFTATAYSRVTGEEFTVNEKKEIEKKELKVSAASTEE